MSAGTSAQSYTHGQLARVRSLCLHTATILGDYRDDIVVVGGLVPSLLIDARGQQEPHVGTSDLDLGLRLSVRDSGAYEDIAARLRRHGFESDTNANTNLSRYRWRHVSHRALTLDFLMPTAETTAAAGRLQQLDGDFAAVLADGLELAFEDRVAVELSGATLDDDLATRSIWVCGPGAYVVLKAIAYERRGNPKDVYDLLYVVRYFGDGVDDVACRLATMRSHAATVRALTTLRRDYASPDHIGPRVYARFLAGAPDDDLQTDAFGLVEALLFAVDTTRLADDTGRSTS